MPIVSPPTWHSREHLEVAEGDQAAMINSTEEALYRSTACVRRTEMSLRGEALVRTQPIYFFSDATCLSHSPHAHSDEYQGPKVDNCLTSIDYLTC